MEDYKTLAALIKEAEDSNNRSSAEPEGSARAIATSAFVKQSFEAVLKLHTEITASKEHEIESLKSYNTLLEELVKEIQEVHSEDRQTIKILQKEIENLQDELEYTKRKYKLMWNKAVENYRK